MFVLPSAGTHRRSGGPAHQSLPLLQLTIFAVGGAQRAVAEVLNEVKVGMTWIPEGRSQDTLSSCANGRPMFGFSVFVRVPDVSLRESSMEFLKTVRAAVQI